MSTTAFPLIDAVGLADASSGPELANIYLHARYYDAALGIFLSPDPAEEDLNTYRYAFNDPVDMSDPSGLGIVCVTSNDHQRQRADGSWENIGEDHEQCVWVPDVMRVLIQSGGGTGPGPRGGRGGRGGGRTTPGTGTGTTGGGTPGSDDTGTQTTGGTDSSGKSAVISVTLQAEGGLPWVLNGALQISFSLVVSTCGYSYGLSGGGFGEVTGNYFELVQSPVADTPAVRPFALGLAAGPSASVGVMNSRRTADIRGPFQTVNVDSPTLGGSVQYAGDLNVRSVSTGGGVAGSTFKTNTAAVGVGCGK